jgi:hypothetical protein
MVGSIAEALHKAKTLRQQEKESNHE